MSENLFKEESTTTTQEVVPQDDALNLDVFATKLMEIKNERGEPKYDSLTKALDALKASQEFIPQLKTQLSQREQELAELRAELDKRASVEEVISRFSTRQPQEPQPTSEAPKALDETAVQRMLQQALSQEKARNIATENVTAVREALVAKFGDKAQEEVKAKASELGMTMDEVSAMSAKTPKAVLAWFNVFNSSPTSAPARSTVTLQDKPKDVPIGKQTGLLRGAKQVDQIAFWRKIKEDVYKQNGIDS